VCPEGRLSVLTPWQVMKLQLMIARLNSALEEQCGAVVAAVPRIVREAGQLEQEAGLLRDKLVTARAEVARVEGETAENMGTLVRSGEGLVTK
jgi:hypothetical protein